VNRVFAWVQVKHAKKPYPRPVNGIVNPDNFHCVASAEMMLPATHEGVDALRFCSMAYRITQNTSEGWDTFPAWDGYMAFGLAEVRSSQPGDVVVVSLWSEAKGGYLPPQWFEAQPMGAFKPVTPMDSRLNWRRWINVSPDQAVPA
jgi:hypothetical protein